jgi:hypothetical protein
MTGARTFTINVVLPSTAPETVNGNTNICSGSSTALSAAGGQLGTNGSYQWGTGSVVGSGAILSTAATLNVTPTTTTTYWVRRRDTGACSAFTGGITVTVTVATPSSAPTTITGSGTICHGSGTTLSVSGGTLGNDAYYEWGTGPVGSSIISGENSASITVAPTENTTYWVRRRDITCNNTTAATTFIVYVTAQSVAGILNAPTTTLCRNAIANDITISGHTGSVLMWQIANDASFTAGSVNIASNATTLTGGQIGPISNTKYIRAVIQNSSCSTVYTAPIALVIAPVSVYSSGSWNTVPGPVSDIEITSDLTLSEDLAICSCKVSGSATLTIPGNITLTAQRDIEVVAGANMLVSTSGSIVQIDNDGVNTGNVTVKRNTSPMKQYDYTYWSSPVAGWKLQQLSPLTLFDKYFSFNPLINNWVVNPYGTAIMEAAKGYIIRAPQGWSLTNATSGVFTGTFIGVPNTGTVAVPIKKGTSDLNLIGNPYPSAIDIDLFLTDPANENVVNGTIYLWTHNTAISNLIPGNAVYNYTADDYAKYNLTGGVKTSNAAITGGEAPTGKIASGQAFFIAAHPSLAAGSYNASFNNSMRIINNNTQFFKSEGNATALSPVEKHRVWLNIKNAAGAYDEMLLGYVQGATQAYDTRYDGKVMPGGNNVGLYSILNSDKLSIQGRGLPFNQADVIPLGYFSTVAGTFNIALENFDGLFNNQDVYLTDKLLNITHNLKSGAYSFSTANGTFDQRFELRFVDVALGTDDLIVRDELIILATNGQVSVKAGNNIIESVDVYDLTGKRLLHKSNIGSNTFNSSELNIATQVVLVKVSLGNDQVVAAKLLID